MINFDLTEEISGYSTAYEQTNAPSSFLIAGSKNVLIDGIVGKVKSRGGYTRLGAANTALTEIRNAWTWFDSNGHAWSQRFYDDELEVYLGTIDGTAINAWTRVEDGWSTTEKLRPATWFDTGENIDLQIMVQGDANLYEWNGAVAVVSSITGTTITKAGTTTFAQNRFYTTRNKTVVCVRTGTEYTYTGGETTTSLTGIADTAGLVAGDILVQKIVTTSNKPVASHTNHLIHSFENQIVIGSEDDEEIYFSQNDDYDDFSFSTPRASGEGGLFTVEDIPRAINSIGKYLLVFAGRSSIMKTRFEQITVSTTPSTAIAETLKLEKVFSGIDQGALNHESVVPMGNSLAYMTNEPAIRIISNPEDIGGVNPKTFSNPIKPDFDGEDFTGAFGFWYKNILIFTSPVNSKMYMLNFVEDADGKVRRFWNPPQVLPVGAMSIIDSGDGFLLHGHSNGIPETYLLFDGASDGNYDGIASADKLPINAKAVFAYNNYGERSLLKNFDEYYVEGEITPNTIDLIMTLNYDFDGATQIIEKTIDGSNEDILEGSVSSNGLGQSSMAYNPLGSLLNPPSNARKFRVIFEMSREDFFEMNVAFECNESDRYFSIISHGASAKLSKRRATNIKL